MPEGNFLLVQLVIFNTIRLADCHIVNSLTRRMILVTFNLGRFSKNQNTSLQYVTMITTDILVEGARKR